MKLPTIELPKFTVNIKEWRSFWSVFRKIQEDASIRIKDKCQFLIQPTVAESREYSVVSSFPPTAKNYDAVITSLKNRFGRDDVITEFYVRELLGLVLQNAANGEKRATFASIYDKIESYIRALQKKCFALGNGTVLETLRRQRMQTISPRQKIA